MAARALCGHVIELFAPRDGGLVLSGPRIRRRLDCLARLLFEPLGREGLDVLDDVRELLIGHVPRKHRGAVEALLHDAPEVVVVRKRAAFDRGELELALREVTRRRTKTERRRPVSVAFFAVARAAIVRVRFET